MSASVSRSLASLVFSRHNSAYRLCLVSAVMLLLSLLCLPFADLAIYRLEPQAELARIMHGFLHPQIADNWADNRFLLDAVLQTVAFALLAVAGAALAGLCLALVFAHRVVRVFCASIRAVHELFWGLIFMQIFGLSALTGILALFIPFSGIFAKVFAEIIEQQSPLPAASVSPKSTRLSCYLYTWLPQAWPQLLTYTRYRFECALRSSTILGFIGLPTLGFYLETAFKQGQYSEAATLLYVFFALIATIRWWLRPALIPVYLLIAWWVLPESPPVYGSTFWQFISQDIWPRSVQNGDWTAALLWYQHQLGQFALPALVDTVLLSQLALSLSAVLALITYPWASRQFLSSTPIAQTWRSVGKTVLLILRSTPEMILAFILLLLFGPSGLPAVIALAMHNGGLIAFLVARQSNELTLRADACRGVNRYVYEISPRIYPQLMALLFYRWEVILRESAILGILGVTTLGFYIDSAFEDIRYDRAFLLIVIAALLNIVVDSLARRLRRYCHLHAVPSM